MTKLLFAALLLLSKQYNSGVAATDLNDYNVRPVCSAGDGIRRLQDVDYPIKTSSIEEIKFNILNRRLAKSTDTTNNNKVVNFTAGTSGLDGSGGCNPPCSDDFMEFCGKDGQCHESTCKNIYKYGNSSFTGMLNDNPPDLTCTIIDPLTTDMDLVPVAVSYSCVGYSCSDGIGIDDTSRKNVIHMNQYCHAQPIDDYAFLCYELVPQNETDFFSEFVNKTNGTTTGYGCDETWLDPQDTVPQYIYQMSYGYLSQSAFGGDQNNTNCTNVNAFLCEYGAYTAYGGQNESIFNESIAYNTFYAQLSYILPATVAPTSSPAPTMAPTYAAPTASAASSQFSIKVSKYPEIIILLLGFLLF